MEAGRWPVERISWSGLKRLVEQQDRKKLLLFLEGQARVLEMIAQSSIPLATVLDELMRVLEEQVEGMACSVLLLSGDGKHLLHGAAPGLPDRYNRAIDGLAIGPRAGSCGTAAFLGRPVIVTDIADDPLWADYQGSGARRRASRLLVDADLLRAWRGAGHVRDVLSPAARAFGDAPQPDRSRDAPGADRDRARPGRARTRAPLGREALRRPLPDGPAGHARGRVGMGSAERPRAMERRHGHLWLRPARRRTHTWDWWTGHIHPEEVELVRRGIARAVRLGRITLGGGVSFSPQGRDLRRASPLAASSSATMRARPCAWWARCRTSRDASATSRKRSGWPSASARRRSQRRRHVAHGSAEPSSSTPMPA